MKIVLDANVFFSAHLWGGNPYRIVERYAEGLDTLFITDDIIGEIRDTLKKPKFNLAQERIDSIIASIERYGQKISIPLNHQVIGVCRDADDDKYISCALAAPPPNPPDGVRPLPAPRLGFPRPPHFHASKPTARDAPSGVPCTAKFWF